MELLDVLDNLNVLTVIKFVAYQYDRLPGYGPEEINMCSLAERQIAADKKITELAAKIDHLPGEAVTSALNTTMTLVQEQLHELTTTINVTRSQNVTKSSTTEHDRQSNVVINGISENRDRNMWSNNVRKVLHCAAGYEVVVSDAFRIGRYCESKCRPVLVKLNSIWDKRIVVNGSRRLADVPEFRGMVYIHADEPPEVRRLKMLNRLKMRAVAAGQKVLVKDDMLFVDDNAVFSSISGFVRKRSPNVVEPRHNDLAQDG